LPTTDTELKLIAAAAALDGGSLMQVRTSPGPAFYFDPLVLKTKW